MKSKTQNQERFKIWKQDCWKIFLPIKINDDVNLDLTWTWPGLIWSHTEVLWEAPLPPPLCPPCKCEEQDWNMEVIKAKVLFIQAMRQNTHTHTHTRIVCEFVWFIITNQQTVSCLNSFYDFTFHFICFYLHLTVNKLQAAVSGSQLINQSPLLVSSPLSSSSSTFRQCLPSSTPPHENSSDAVLVAH